MGFSLVLDWVKKVTDGLFATLERPIFLLVCESGLEDFKNGLCHILAILGADVVCICDKKFIRDLNYLDFDGFFTLSDGKTTANVEFFRLSEKRGRKTYKKSFISTSFGCIGNIHRFS